MEPSEQEPAKIENGVLIIPESWTVLPASEFSGQSGFFTVQLPKHPIKLESECFLGCTDLQEFTFPDWVTEIPDGFLSACEHLTTVHFSEGLEEIHEGAFLMCENLIDVNFPSTLKQIDSIAFYSTGLQQISLPPATESVGMEAFGSCPSLTRIEVNNPDVPADPFFLSDPDTGDGNLFGDDVPCPIREGYLAKGVPDDPMDPCAKWYALLWATEPDRHSDPVSEEILNWIYLHEEVLMDIIFRQQNLKALRTLVNRHGISPDNLEKYRARAVKLGNPELTALLLDAGDPAGTTNLEEEFAL